MHLGTDGIRGRYPQDMNLLVAGPFGAAMVAALGPTVAIGRDTRPSSAELALAVAAGVEAAGGQATDLGVLPTAGCSAWVAAAGLDAGVMVTASHNPASDNGLKPLGAGGRKLDADERSRLQDALAQPVRAHLPPGRQLVLDGRPVGEDRSLDAAAHYTRALLGALPGGAWLSGRRLVVDDAGGASREFAAGIVGALGAVAIRVTAAGINGSGVMAPAAAVAAARGEDAGILLDGDADRVALVTPGGRILDGDDILYLLRRPPAVVGTVMSNEGLARALEAERIAFHRAAVGDAEVAATMGRAGALVGGEPSGHILLADGLPTADGLLAALRVLHLLGGTLAGADAALSGLSKSAQAHAVIRRAVELGPGGIVAREVRAIEAQGARVVVRASGTEPVVRVMVEHDHPGVAKAGADRLVAIAERS